MGAGKSNLIGAFRLLGQIVQGRLQEYVARQGGAARLLHFGPKVAPDMSMRFNFGVNGYSFRLDPTADDQLFFKRRRSIFEETEIRITKNYLPGGIARRFCHRSILPVELLIMSWKAFKAGLSIISMTRPIIAHQN